MLSGHGLEVRGSNLGAVVGHPGICLSVSPRCFHASADATSPRATPAESLPFIIIRGAIQKFPKFEFCANGCECIEMPIDVSHHPSLFSVASGGDLSCWVHCL
jgi:hypothetical protein